MLNKIINSSFIMRIRRQVKFKLVIYKKILIIIALFMMLVLLLRPHRNVIVDDHDNKPTINIDPQELITSRFSHLDGVHVCVAGRSFVAVGGVEAWMDHLIQILQPSKFHLIGVHISSLFSTRYHRMLEKHGLRHLSAYDVSMDCDIVIGTQVTNFRNTYNILVVHGSDEDYTKPYASRSRFYDDVVVVSEDSRNVINILDRDKATWIPSGVIDSDCTTKYNYKDYILYIGRISDEKNLITLCNKLTEFSLFGILVGPNYFGDFVPYECRKTVWIRLADCPQSLIKNARALWITSKKEGGPIVVLEAMRYKTPVIMSRTGIALNIGDIVTTNWDITLDQYLRLEQVAKENAVRLKEHYDAVFGDDIILSRWIDILSVPYIENDLSVSGCDSVLQSSVGRRVTLLCPRGVCTCVIKSREGMVYFVDDGSLSFYSKMIKIMFHSIVEVSPRLVYRDNN